MRIESPKYAAVALRSFSSKVRRRATDVEQSTNYHQLLGDEDSSSPRYLPDNEFLRKKSNDCKRNTTTASFADTSTERADVRNCQYTSTDDESRDDDHMRLLSNYDEQIEDRCQVLELLSSEDGKPFNYSTTKKRLLLPGSVELGGSSRQGPMTLHELGFKPLQKTVHFSTVEVKTYHWDRINNKYVYYTKDELSKMGYQRNEDACKLRKERLFSGHSEKDLTPTLLSFIFDPNEDIYKGASSRGIEHYVYPELRREIVRKQKICKSRSIELRAFQPIRS